MTRHYREARRESFAAIDQTCPIIDAAFEEALRTVKGRTDAFREALIDAFERAFEAEEQVRDLVSRAEKAERERDEARAERDAYKRAKEENDDRFMRERDEARAERDARPDISAEDAAAWVRCIDVSDEPGGAADVVKYRAVNDALCAHAAKAVKP